MDEINQASSQAQSLAPVNVLKSIRLAGSLPRRRLHRPTLRTLHRLCCFQRTAPPSRNAGGANADQKQKLNACNITFDIGPTLPSELKCHIDLPLGSQSCATFQKTTLHALALPTLRAHICIHMPKDLSVRDWRTPQLQHCRFRCLIAG